MTDATVEPQPFGPHARQLPFSRAYERFVQADGDTIGLIAYALYKASIRQEAMEGIISAARPRAPVPAQVNVYRQAAEQLIGQVISDAIEQATPGIQASAMLDAVNAASAANTTVSETVERNLKHHFDQRTGFWQSIGTSFVGWLLTLGVTAIIIFVAGRPSIEDRVKRAVTAPAVSTRVDNANGEYQ